MFPKPHPDKTDNQINKNNYTPISLRNVDVKI